MSNASFEVQWESILGNFDWGKVHSVMYFLNWKWVGCEGVPERSDIIKSAKERCKNAYDLDGGGFCESGGLRATNSNGNIELIFKIEGWEEEL